MHAISVIKKLSLQQLSDVLKLGGLTLHYLPPTAYDGVRSSAFLISLLFT